MSQKVVVAQYHAPEAIFKIPKGIDLKDKTKVCDKDGFEMMYKNGDKISKDVSRNSNMAPRAQCQ